MTREQSMLHAKTVALALYQIRILLSDYLGGQNDGDMSVRRAAHLAYALHNEALAIVEGGSFDAEAVARRLTAVDGMLGSQFADLFKRVLSPSAPLETRDAWARLPPDIADRVAAWVAQTPKDGGHVDNEAARYGGLSLMRASGAIWLLRPDATFWEVDDDSGRPLQPLPTHLHTMALVVGAQRHPWLSELLPARPPSATQCSTCHGEGLIADAAYCSTCSALGWLPADKVD